MGSRAGAIGAQWVETLAAVSDCLNLLPRTHKAKVFLWPPHVCTVASMHPWKIKGVGRRKRKKRESKYINAIFKVGDIFSPNSSNKQFLVPINLQQTAWSRAAHSATRDPAQWWASWIQNPEVLHLTVRSVPCKLCDLGKLPDVYLGFLRS